MKKNSRCSSNTTFLLWKKCFLIFFIVGTKTLAKNIFKKIEMINHKIRAYIYFTNLNNINKSKDPYIKFQIINEKIKLYHL
jgi:hypothetical protein